MKSPGEVLSNDLKKYHFKKFIAAEIDHVNSMDNKKEQKYQKGGIDYLKSLESSLVENINNKSANRVASNNTSYILPISNNVSFFNNQNNHHEKSIRFDFSNQNDPITSPTI